MHLQVLGGDKGPSHVGSRGCQGGVCVDPEPSLVCCSPSFTIPQHLYQPGMSCCVSSQIHTKQHGVPI